jgi:hypothetical protein
MNSVTGKFGYRRENRHEIEVRLEDFDKYKSLGYIGIMSKGDGNIIMRKSGDREYSHYSSGVVYAHITAYARDMLYNHVKKIPYEDLLYLATDAIVFKGKNNLKHFNISNKMGDWKVEEEGSEFEAWNEQYYRIDNNIKASGVRKPDVSIKALREGKVETTAMFTIKMAWKKGEFENMGSFEDKLLLLKSVPKRWRYYPKEIREELKSDMFRSIDFIEKIRQENKEKLIKNNL